MAWRLAGSLVRLREQVNAAYPNRSKVSDGTIGDAAHAADKTSDHNPNAAGVVRAFDITHDPAHGLDIWVLANALAASRDSRIYYLIANGKIMVPQKHAWNVSAGWFWQTYLGSNPHTSHLHVSVYGDYDINADWNIGGDNMDKDILIAELTKQRDEVTEKLIRQEIATEQVTKQRDEVTQTLINTEILLRDAQQALADALVDAEFERLDKQVYVRKGE